MHGRKRDRVFSPRLGNEGEHVGPEAIGLEPNTEYTVCLLAYNLATPSETAESAPKTFKTALAPETPFTREAKSITGSSAVLHGELNPGATSADPNTEDYDFAYAPSGSECTGGLVAPEPAAVATGDPKEGVEAAVTGLEGNTEYAFCVVAIDKNVLGPIEGRESATATPATFKTLPVPPKLEGSPTATAVTPVQEQLEAQVNPENQPTTSCVFEYGETLTYGKKAACAPPSVEGSSVQVVGANLSALNANKTYDYRVVVKNATGQAIGTGVFKTAVAGAPTVETGSEKASAVTSTGARLEARVNPDYQETTYAFEYSTSKAEVEAGKGTLLAGVAALEGFGDKPASAPTGALLAGTTYYYRVVATNATPPAADGTVQEFTTVPLPTVQAPGPLGTTTATLQGKLTPLNLTVGTEYSFQYNLGSACAGGVLSTPVLALTEAVTEALTGLEPSATYTVCLVASNVFGSQTSAPVSFTTLPLAPEVSGETTSGVTPYEANLEAQVNPNNQKTMSCEFEYGPTTSYGTKAPCEPASLEGASTQEVSAHIKGMSSATEYHFRLVVKNATGGTLGADAEFETLAATAPVVEAEAASGVTPFVATLEATVNPEYQETTCKFEYSTAKSKLEHDEAVPFEGCPAALGSGNGGVGTSVSLTGLTSKTTYYFRVVATNGTGASKGTVAEPISEFTTETTKAPIVESESSSHLTPSEATLKAQVNPEYQKTEVTFEYADEAQGGEEGLLEGRGTKVSARSLPALGTGQPAAVNLTALTAGKTYYFRVIATNPAGTTENKGVIQKFETLALGKPQVQSESSSGVTSSTAKLEATVDPEFQETTCTFEYAPTKTAVEAGHGASLPCSKALGAENAGVATSVILTGLSPKTPYFYRVVATNGTGTEVGPTETFTTQVAVPPPPSSAPSPWYRISDVDRPGNLTAGKARSEVQELTASPGETEGGSRGEFFTIHIGSETGPIVGTFVTEQLALAHPTDLEPTAANVQKALEAEALYGKGNVEVTSEGGPNGLPPLKVRTLRPGSVVPPLAIKAHVGEASASVTVTGRPDDFIALTILNVGDASASFEQGNAGVPLTVADKLPKGLRAVSMTGGFARNPEVAQCDVATVSCTLSQGALAPFVEQVEVEIGIVLEPGAASGEVNTASVSGGEGFSCHGVAGGTGRFDGTGCIREAGSQSFERAATVLAPSTQDSHPIVVSGSPTPFGAEEYGMRNEEADGRPATQAGSHPFQTTFTLNFNQDLVQGARQEVGVPVALAKDLTFKLPAGWIGDPTAYPRCSLHQFSTNTCPAETIVGVGSVGFHEPFLGRNTEIGTSAEPIFDVEPSLGESARFAFKPDDVSVYLDISVRTGEDYGVVTHVENVPQTIGFMTNTLTFWGVPGDTRHDDARSYQCLEQLEGDENAGVCNPPQPNDPPPFLSLPTSCSKNPSTGQPELLKSTFEADSWEQPAVFTTPFTTTMPGMDGCGDLEFGSEIQASPDVEAASTPSGLKVNVHVPQEEALSAAGIAPAEVKNITVALPAGVHLNPSSADGLQACTSNPGALLGGELGSPGDQVGFTGLSELPDIPGTKIATFTPSLPGTFDTRGAVALHELPESEATEQPGVNFCSNASKIGEATIKSPLLPEPLTGFVYLAAQEANPFDSVFAMYLVAEDKQAGVLVKLPGEVTLCKGAGEVIDGMTCRELGQIVTTFQNNPQLPFEDAELHFFGGERAPLATPARCGSYTTEASFEPWTNGGAIQENLHSTSTFHISSGPNHTACPGAQLPFSPTLTGGALNVNAGAFSPFDATFSRQSGEQNMRSIEVHLPPGLSGILAGVELCPEPQANLGECGPNSLIGETTVAVGVGGQPYTVSGGKFYLTGPYNGTGTCTVGTSGCAPFGITFVVPAKAGPFDLAKTANNHPACDCVLVRGKIEINPLTAAITIVSDSPGTPDSIPTSLEGIPLEIQHINAVTTRSNFQFNPTNCNKTEVTGTIHSSEGGSDGVGVPFQVTNCAALKFEPKFAVSTSGKTSKANGASLTAKVTYPNVPQGTDSDITKVKVELPKQLPSRLTTLQKACTNAQFESNPAGCPVPSVIGHATVHTPVIPVPLEGPVYFVSHGGEAFPSLEMVLQGYGAEDHPRRHDLHHQNWDHLDDVQDGPRPALQLL